MKTLASLALAAAVLAIAGCAAQTDVDEPTRSPRAVQTPSYATENQVASALAEYAPDMQRIIDNASMCRLQAATDPSGLAVVGCGYDEQTIGLDAQLVVEKWSGLNIPPSLRTLWADTSEVLEKIADIDVVTPCGDGFSTVGTEECSAALALRFAQYAELDSKLAAWSPYL